MQAKPLDPTTPQLRAELDRFAANYRLTTREYDVLFLLISGHSSVPLIADRLSLSQNTVHNHFKNVFRRTRTNSKAGLLSLFIKDSIGRAASMQTFVKRPRVLLLEPDARTRDNLVRTLSKRGLHVYAEDDSRRAVRRIRELRIDAVVTDVTLPGEGGDGVLRDVVDSFGKHPQVFVTSDAPDLDATAWQERGAAGAFARPVSTDRLAFAILENFVDSPYERNRLVRVDTALPTRVDGERPASIDNLGFGGAFLAVPDDELEDPARYAVGRRVSLAFALEEQPPVEVQGEVMWRRRSARPSMPSGVGVRFVDLSESQQAQVEEYVRRRKLMGFMPWLSEDAPPRDVEGEAG